MMAANLALAFLLELAMLVAFGYWGFQTGETTMARIGLGLGLPLLAAVLWGIFMAPSSSRRLQGAAYLAVKVMLFGLAAAALILAGRPALGIMLSVAFVINTILLHVWRQPAG
jgi:hypothetical protein